MIWICMLNYSNKALHMDSQPTAPAFLLKLTEYIHFLFTDLQEHILNSFVNLQISFQT